VRWENLTAVPWKNGGGTTRQLAIAPAGAGFAEFGWSVSIADIASDGPFSDFAGVDRVIMLIDGDELILEVAGTPHTLDRLGTLAFSGEATTACRVPSGPVRGLNLMTRRGRATGAMRTVEVPHRHTVTVGHLEAVVLVALTGSLTLDGDVALGALDAAVEDAPGRLAVTGSGTFAELRVAELRITEAGIGRRPSAAG
jgi:environmental stress-induced protein Ves